MSKYRFCLNQNKRECMSHYKLLIWTIPKYFNTNLNKSNTQLSQRLTTTCLVPWRNQSLSSRRAKLNENQSKSSMYNFKMKTNIFNIKRILKMITSSSNLEFRIMFSNNLNPNREDIAIGDLAKTVPSPLLVKICAISCKSQIVRLIVSMVNLHVTISKWNLKW
jgi:hypothetical protein